MKICDDNNSHGQIVYNDNRCYACQRIEDLENELENVREVMKGLETENGRLEAASR